MSITAKRYSKGLVYKIHPRAINTEGSIWANKNRQLIFQDWYCDMLRVLFGHPVCCDLLFLLGLAWASQVKTVFWFTSLLFLPTSRYKPDLCTLCKSDDNCNWLYTIKHHCDSCLTRRLYWCIKLSNKFPYDCTTTPCQTTELAEKSVMINVIPAARHTSLCMKEGQQMISFY